GSQLVCLRRDRSGNRGQDFRAGRARNRGHELSRRCPASAGARRRQRRRGPRVGTGARFPRQGRPAIGVAAMYGPPMNLALVLPFDTPIKTVSDLKGKRIGVTTAGSLTDWLVRELSRQQGWGSDGIQILALGQMQARLAAIQRG